MSEERREAIEAELARYEYQYRRSVELKAELAELDKDSESHQTLINAFETLLESPPVSGRVVISFDWAAKFNSAEAHVNDYNWVFSTALQIRNLEVEGLPEGVQLQHVSFDLDGNELRVCEDADEDLCAEGAGLLNYEASQVVENTERGQNRALQTAMQNVEARKAAKPGE